MEQIDGLKVLMIKKKVLVLTFEPSIYKCNLF